MFELIVLVIFVISVGGVLFILIRKISALNMLPQNGASGIKNHKFITEIEKRFKKVSTFLKRKFSLHKILSWTKIITLKIEVLIDHWLHKARRNAQKNKPK
jgi:hypothetical protein